MSTVNKPMSLFDSVLTVCVAMVSMVTSGGCGGGGGSGIVGVPTGESVVILEQWKGMVDNTLY